jgi:DNA modification methylase
MEIPNGTIDGILFSPPYSFAIDYLGNDAFHLAALGADMSELANNMIGLRGGPRLAEKYALYLEDMQSVLNECYRVLKPDRYCVIVVGTNNNQLGKVLKVSPDEVTGLNLILRSQAEAARFTFINEMPRSIKGMANTMREEFIIFLHKG